MKLLVCFAAKFGVDPSGCVELAKHVKLNCPNLVFSGLMTIGMLDYSSTPENFKVIYTLGYNLSGVTCLSGC
jgi:uncharacterized pyridoxal phosphate-containing UPF0001 family protein